jgi:glycosyltransferase involved in cell wall biosynthesis
MKLIYATDINADNIHNWSGLSWYYRHMLEQAGCEVSVLDRTEMPPPVYFKLKMRLLNNVLHRQYSQRFSNKISRYYAKKIQEKAAPGSVILSPNTVVLADLKGNYKKVLYADATFNSLLHLYPKYRRFTAECLREGEEIDRRAIKNADLLIYTSKWAADSAISHYGADPSKVFMVPFGANLDKLPTLEVVKNNITERIKSKHINLFFLGIDWIRKGGDYALRVATKLNELGYPATLHIAGVNDLPAHTNQEFIVNHGFISKATPEGQQALGKLLATSHFLILPTLADCTPVACSEASAFGVPCITSDVGGLKSVIMDNVNGHTFPLRNFVDEAVNYILHMTEQRNDYKALCCSSYHMFATELNWKSVGQKIVELIKTI